MKFIYSKFFVIFAFVLVILFAGLVMQSKGWLQPIEYILLQSPQPLIKVTNWMIRPVVTTINTFGSLSSLVKENTQFSVQVTTLQQQLIELDRFRSENEILKAELGFVSKSKYQLQPCTILSSDTQGVTDVINLNCGQSSGIEAGYAVVAQGYIIAKIIHVGNLTSSAVLLTNAQQTIDAKLSKNNTEGVVKGSFGSGLVFDLVSQSANVGLGDLVVTAGIDPKIPRDILIGEVGQELSGQNDLFKELTVVSPIKTHTIDHVFIVKP